jgi:hypothetical protein
MSQVRRDAGKIRQMRSWSFIAALVVATCGVVVWAQGAAKTPATPAPSQAAQRVTYPPIPNPGFAPGRPVDQTRAVYQFAAEHPEVLKFVPCYCGCESTGHPHNESCFVKRRDAAGNVVEWDVHGYS